MSRAAESIHTEETIVRSMVGLGGGGETPKVVGS